MTMKYEDVAYSIVGRYPGIENTLAVVTTYPLGAYVYRVILFDVDVHLSVGGSRLFNDLGAAHIYAKSLVTPPKEVTLL